MTQHDISLFIVLAASDCVVMQVISLCEVWPGIASLTSQTHHKNMHYFLKGYT